ncbi:unnamed protein product [Caenorhabditis bovis]|uniref:Uncharacterized protein n=1 Tax=Caenorhabditis bovis TaxID=2654633 RepID=A0A8S1EH36_9PELO|nr:unnamed protein product [Caenorhabditis bovis]
MNVSGTRSSAHTLCVGVARCLEGSDCVLDASCGECSGVACTRILSNNMDDNKDIALTCLPYDTRGYRTPQLEEDGCRQVGDRQICICYSHDYCNSTYHRQLMGLSCVLLLINLLNVL